MNFSEDQELVFIVLLEHPENSHMENASVIFQTRYSMSHETSHNGHIGQANRKYFGIIVNNKLLITQRCW